MWSCVVRYASACAHLALSELRVVEQFVNAVGLLGGERDGGLHGCLLGLLYIRACAEIMGRGQKGQVAWGRMGSAWAHHVVLGRGDWLDQVDEAAGEAAAQCYQRSAKADVS